MRVLGLFTRFPGAPEGTDIVGNLNYYERETGLAEADYYLVSTADRSGPGLDRAVRSLSALKDSVESSASRHQQPRLTKTSRA